MPKKINLIGRQFHRLLVIAEEGQRDKRGHVVWSCVCDCGNKSFVSGDKLKSGNTQSCGCLFAEKRAAGSYRSHGKTGSRVYRIWVNMISRCTRPSTSCWHNYGGRGITVCDRWRNSFEAFLEDMGEPPTGKHSIDRIDNDGNYEPSNCRWVTKNEQSFNTRRTKIVVIAGTPYTLLELSALHGVSPKLIRTRIYQGWPPEIAAKLPADFTFQKDGRKKLNALIAQSINEALEQEVA